MDGRFSVKLARVGLLRAPIADALGAGVEVSGTQPGAIALAWVEAIEPGSAHKRYRLPLALADWAHQMGRLGLPHGGEAIFVEFGYTDGRAYAEITDD